MGAYLTAPNKDIESETGHGNGLKYAAGSMQGWRRSQEDAHVACPELLAALPEFEKFDDEYIARVRSMSAFGVFDGHGGKEVSMFVSDFILKELFQSKHFQDYNIEQALTHLFHSLDDLLCDPAYQHHLQAYKAVKSPSQRAAASKSANSPEIGDNTHKDVDDNKQQAKDFLRTLLKDRLGNEGIDRALKELDSPGKGLVELDDDSDEEVEESSETAQQNEEVQAMIEDDKKTTENSNYLVESKAEVEGSTEVDGSVREPNEDVVANVSPILDDSDEGTDTELTPPPPINSESIRTVPVHEVSKVVRGAPSCNLPPHRVTAGCTAVFSLLDHQSKTIYVANAGDSRCVLCRGAVAMDLSEDHKPFNEIERNRIESAGGFVSQVGRINNNLNLSRSIGDLKYKQVKGMSAKEQIITAEPDIMCVKYTPEDEFIILACDGVWDVMTNQDICDFVRERLVKYNTMGKKSPLFYDTNGKFQQLDEVNSVKYNLSGTMAMESEDDVYPLDAIIGDVMTYCLADSVSESALGTDNMTCVVIVFDSFLERIKNKDKSLIIVSDADEEENEKIGDIDSGVD